MVNILVSTVKVHSFQYIYTHHSLKGKTKERVHVHDKTIGVRPVNRFLPE